MTLRPAIGPILKPTPVVKERKPLKSRPRPVNARAREATFARDDRTCQWCMVPGGAIVPHHRFRRSQGAPDSPHVMVTVHTICHDEIHRNVAEAKRRKFLVRSEAECAEPWT